MTDYYELVGQVHERLHDEQARRAQVPRNCFFCEYMASRPGHCEKWNQRPPAQWMSKEGACDQWLQEIPF